MATQIIAEAGVNHNGDLSIAKQMVDCAVSAGVDVIKFQTFISEKLASPSATLAPYQKQAGVHEDSQLEMLKKLALSQEQFAELMEYCVRRGIVFMSSPFDQESAHFLNQLGVSQIKLGSGEITDLPLLRTVASFQKPIILSTGMSTIEEITDALNALITAGARKTNITLLHCCSAYPTPVNEVNLSAMLQLKELFGTQVGYSDHTLGYDISVAAVACGAQVIEKHFTLDRSMPGPDQKISLDPNDLAAMVESIRHVESALGDGIKRVTDSERSNRLLSRKSLVTATTISKGDTFSSENLTVKRPGSGVSPMRWDHIIGLKAMRDYQADEQIDNKELPNHRYRHSKNTSLT